MLQIFQDVSAKKTVLIKPNLVEALAPPITTPVRLTQLLIEYDTHYPFQMLGYTKLARCKTYLTG